MAVYRGSRLVEAHIGQGAVAECRTEPLCRLRTGGKTEKNKYCHKNANTKQYMTSFINGLVEKAKQIRHIYSPSELVDVDVVVAW